MVEKFLQIVRRIIQERGPVKLFALVKMDDLADKWSVIISAPWIDERDSEAFTYIFTMTKEVLTPEEQSSIARIGIFPTTSHFVELMTNVAQISGGVVKIEKTKVNGNMLHEAYIFESHKDRVWREATGSLPFGGDQNIAAQEG